MISNNHTLYGMNMNKAMQSLIRKDYRNALSLKMLDLTMQLFIIFKMKPLTLFLYVNLSQSGLRRINVDILKLSDEQKELLKCVI